MTNAISVLDVGVGAAGRSLGLTRLGLHVAREAERRARPVTGAVLAVSRQAPLPSRLRPADWLDTLAREGASQRGRWQHQLTRLLDLVVPRALAEVLARVDVTDLVTRHVDLDTVVAAVDLDRAVRRVDVDAVVRRVDVDAVVARADLDAVVRRVDVDAVVARADLDAVLGRVDLTSVVLQRVDLDAVVQAVLARLDLIGLAEQVIDGVNLAEIIRESTGSMASDTVQEVRLQGIAADDAVSHAIDRFLLRHGRRSTGGPGELEPQRPQVAGEDLTAEGHHPAPHERVP